MNHLVWKILWLHGSKNKILTGNYNSKVLLTWSEQIKQYALSSVKSQKLG